MLSSQDRSAMICFLDGRTRFPPYLPLSCRCSAQVDLRAPSNVAAPSLSVQGTPTDVFQFLDVHLGRFTTGLFPESGKVPPHYLSSFANPSGTKNQKLPIMSNNILSFDRIFYAVYSLLCASVQPDWHSRWRKRLQNI